MGGGEKSGNNEDAVPLCDNENVSCSVWNAI